MVPGALPRDRKNNKASVPQALEVWEGGVLSGLIRPQERIVYSGPEHIHELRYQRGQRSGSIPTLATDWKYPPPGLAELQTH